jgi:hypothetical protein
MFSLFDICGPVQSGMELRVLHAAAHRTTWYGTWGYTFGRGDFNISRATWKKAMSFLHSCPLAPILVDLGDKDAVLVRIIERIRVRMCPSASYRLFVASGPVLLWGKGSLQVVGPSTGSHCAPCWVDW